MTQSKNTTSSNATANNHDPIGNESERMPLRITDTCLRDAHQSLWATRLRTSDIMEIIDTMDNAGFYSLECWGGATFDVCMRFLCEDPWERLRLIKSRAKRTFLQMLLRGQNILGYKNYPDDILERFIALSVKNGIDIFRTFDALNDNRNLEMSIKYIKKYGAHAQGTICYTISPAHTVESFVKVAKEQEQMGIDSLCIKDMAGILSPPAATKLVEALVLNIGVPIQIHCHATSGMAVASYTAGVVAGAGAIDCAISSMAGFSSQPPVETMVAIVSGTKHHTTLDMDALRKINRFFAGLRPIREPEHKMEEIIDPEILLHNTPGGMISNLRSQLAQQGALEKLDDVLNELPSVKADMGYPPLVTPTSQIMGVQSVLNVLAEKRYEMVTQETRDYVKGLYGRPPAPINSAVRDKILGDEKAITVRPADLLPPGLPHAVDGVDPALIKSEEDIISFSLFPEPALAYFKWRDTPAADRPQIPADAELEKRRKPKEKAPEPARPIMAPSDYPALESLMSTVRQLGITELTIRRSDVALTLKNDASGISSASPMADTPATGIGKALSKASVSEPADKPAQADRPASGLPTVNAPLTGTFYRNNKLNQPNLVEEGGTLKGGEPICVIEAMKLFNEIKVERPCKVVRFLVDHGKPVQKGIPITEIMHI